MKRWNGLPYQYWKKVYDSIRAALNKLILQEKGVNNTTEKPIDTRGMAYNKDAMEALLEEPTIEQPIIAPIEIPRANDVYFESEEGVGILEDMEESIDLGGRDGDRDRDGDGDGDGEGDGDEDSEGEDDEDGDEDEDGSEEEDQRGERIL